MNMTLTLKATMNIKIINTYIPQADRPDQEKDKAYENLNKEIRKHNKKTKIHRRRLQCKSSESTKRNGRTDDWKTHI